MNAKPALLPFIMAGDPSLAELPVLLENAARLGIEAIELGVPHSDPVADGETLQAAAARAIDGGTTLRLILKMLAGVSETPDIVLFSYFNPLLQLGKELIPLLKATPVKSLLVVDLPPNEEPAWEAELRHAGYPIIPLLCPNTSRERAADILAARPGPDQKACPEAPFAQCFAYVVGRLGVTGTRESIDLVAVQARIRELSELTSRPLAVGFGLHDPQSLRQIREMGATPIVGSALVDKLHKGQSLQEALDGMF